MIGTVQFDGLDEVAEQVTRELSGRSLEAVTIGGEQLKRDLRAMTRGPLGERIAKAWRLKIYGRDGSENPAAFAWSNAPDVVRGNMENITIVPRGGARFFAIPSKHVLRRRGRGKQKTMTPEDVEAHYDQDLIVTKGRKPGTLLGYIDLNHKRKTRKTRLRLMFTFVMSVHQRKTLDVEGAFRKAADRARRHLENG